MRSMVTTVRPSAKLLAASCFALLAAGCSAATERFAQNPFENPFSRGRGQAEATGSVRSAPLAAAPTGAVSAQPLPPPPQAGYAPPPARYQPSSFSAAAPPVRTAAITPHPAYAITPKPATASVRTAAASPARATAAPTPPMTRAPARAATHKVEPGETLYSVARRYGVGPQSLAASNGLTVDHKVRLGQQLTVPAGAALAVAPAPKALAAASAPRPAAQPAAPRDKEPSVEPGTHLAQAPSAQIVKAVARAEPAPAPAEEEEVTGSIGDGDSSFRWPVRGRVISGFGAKPNGSRNEGINLAVPEGTPVKASEGGVVAYAGNELKGYGNLVLVRHPGGWVTAYAHASEIVVKRGDTVRRGQVIAKAGKSGSVSAPQLHFEVRKGATPVDPLQHLPNG